MIRDKNKIYGELNDPNTVLVTTDLIPNKYVVADENKNVKTFNAGIKKIMTTDSYGKASSFNYNKPNQLIGTDAAGKLSLFPRLSETAPNGRELIAVVSGYSNPSSALNSKTITLAGMQWYEVEVLGAGGGGGAGIGKELSDTELLSGTKGGEGGYYKGKFSLISPANVVLTPGNGGGGGQGINWVSNWPNFGMNPNGTNYGGPGGRTPLLLVTTGNDGENASYSVTGDVDNDKLGGSGENSGADGGDTLVENVGPNLNGEIKGAGAGGGGANGPYGGAGANSIYTNNAGLYGCCSGGAGGAGGGTGIGGNGGHVAGVVPVTYGGGSGGGGCVISLTDYTKSGGGGGGGGASMFICGDVTIICGGGGGGAGAGYGGSKDSNDGQPGTNNKTLLVGGGAAGGLRGEGCNTGNQLEVNCSGKNGTPGVIRLWRCI